eukprot:symbB.v1.2.004107.t1/scaffold231.1/size297012/10
MDPEVLDKAMQLCRQSDTEGEGGLPQAALQAILKEACPAADDEELAHLVSSVDINGDGMVQYEEFLRWLRFPPDSSGVKMAFEDTIKSGLLDRIKLDEVTAEVAPELETPDSVVPAKKSSLEEEDDILMEDFVHPLLERFSVAKDDKPLEPGMLPVKLGSSREGGTVKMLGSALEASPAECHQANSLPDLLAALSQAYRAVLEAFLQDGKYTALRLVPLPVAAKIGAPLKRALMPQPLWSAVALALAQLNAKQQAKLEDLKVELFAPGAAAEALRDTLKSKSSMATNDFTVDNKRGRIPLRKEGYSWCRRDNDQDARLYRLEAFMHTQRAVYAKSFSVESKEINLDTEKMLSGTRVFIGGSAGTNTNGEEDPETPIPFRLTRVEELFKESPKPKGETVMEVAAFMVAKGAKVVAVNAASAYQVGGGSTTGGRHALEEAWCISSTLYQSLASVEPIKGGFPGYRQHVPVMGCIISPAVQLSERFTAIMSTPQIPTSLWQKAARALMSDEKKEDDAGEDNKDDKKAALEQAIMSLKPEGPPKMIPPKFSGPGGCGGCGMPGCGGCGPMGPPGCGPGFPPMPGMPGMPSMPGMPGMPGLPPMPGGCGCPPPIPVKSGGPPPRPNMAMIPAKSASLGPPGGKDDDDDDDSDDDSSEEGGPGPNPMMMLMMLKQMQSSIKQNMAKAPPEMQEQQKMLLQMKMDASSNLLNVASSTASSAAMPNMGLPAAQAMAAAGASPEMLQMMQSMGMASGYVDPSQKGAVEAQQEALAQAARELQAAQEAAQAQQAALEAMSPEQREAVLAAMSAASEAQQAQQSQFYEAMKAHEMEKLQKSGYYQSNQPERFKDGYRPLRMCKHFKTDQCWRGQECTYAHSLEELHPASPDLPRVEVKETNALAEQQKVEDSAPDVRLKKKKELCNKWKNGQDCVLGRACPYAHGEKELGTVELVVCGRVKTRICKFWTTGNCMFLGNCVNAHGEKELGTKRPDFMTPPMKKRREGESIDQFREQVIAKGGKGKGKGGAGNH